MHLTPIRSSRFEQPTKDASGRRIRLQGAQRPHQRIEVLVGHRWLMDRTLEGASSGPGQHRPRATRQPAAPNDTTPAPAAPATRRFHIAPAQRADPHGRDTIPRPAGRLRNCEPCGAAQEAARPRVAAPQSPTEEISRRIPRASALRPRSASSVEREAEAPSLPDLRTDTSTELSSRREIPTHRDAYGEDPC